MSKKQWSLAWVAVLAVMVGAAATEQPGPRADEFRDGPFFVSWRYTTRSGSVVAPTPKVSSKEPPTFHVGDGYEFNITVRVPPGRENPCRYGECDMEAEITVVDPEGHRGTPRNWSQSSVLTAGLETFSFAGVTKYYHAEYKYYLDYHIRKKGKSLVEQNHFPFRVTQP